MDQLSDEQRGKLRKASNVRLHTILVNLGFDVEQIQVLSRSEKMEKIAKEWVVKKGTPEGKEVEESLMEEAEEEPKPVHKSEMIFLEMWMKKEQERLDREEHKEQERIKQERERIKHEEQLVQERIKHEEQKEQERIKRDEQKE